MTNQPVTLGAYIGTYTRPTPYISGKSEGIYLYRLDLTTGAFTYANQVTAAINSSFMACRLPDMFLQIQIRCSGRQIENLKSSLLTRTQPTEEAHKINRYS